ncbi:MAG: aspartate carbamoyltransferase regulatory subunit [Anaerovoracaceae bacterium]|jgi:aspartate carbamoyltransferase regulatory subunit
MNIDGIKTGTVLDHIKAGKAMEVYDLLGLGGRDCTIAIIQNARSTKYGKKDIIKIDADIDIDFKALGYIDTNITVNRIQNGSLVYKMKLDLPEMLTNVIYCNNPRCITSTEQGIDHKFRLVDREHKIYRCVYCDAIHKGE